MMRLTAQDQIEVTTEFSNRYLAAVQDCVHAGARRGVAAH